MFWFDTWYLSFNPQLAKEIGLKPDIFIRYHMNIEMWEYMHIKLANEDRML